MNLPKEAIQEFKEIYQRLSDEEISDEEAVKMAAELIELCSLVVRTNLPK